MPTLRMIDNSMESPAIHIKINNTWWYFLLDTGAQTSHIRNAVAQCRSFGRNGFSVGVGGQEPARECVTPFRLMNVTIDSFVIGDSVAKRMSETTGMNFGGILGNDFMRQFKSVTFDYPNKKVRFEI